MGFSLSDMVANASGSLFFIFQQKIFKEQIIKPKLSFQDQSMLGSQTDILEKIILFLNFYTITTVIPFVFNFSKKYFSKSKIPKWFNVSFGYGSMG